MGDESMPLILGFHIKHIQNPSDMHYNPVKVSLMAFTILFQILSVVAEVTAVLILQQNTISNFCTQLDKIAKANYLEIFFQGTSLPNLLQSSLHSIDLYCEINLPYSLTRSYSCGILMMIHIHSQL